MRRSGRKLAAIPVNQYGNVDVRYGPPAGHAHVPGARVTVACKALNIECAPAFVGFDKSRGRFKPETDGVVVASADADRLRAYLAEREERGKKAAPARQARAAKKSLDRERLAESLGVRSDSRTFEAFLRGEIDAEEARRVGRITSHRHEQTDYDELLRAGYSKEDVRAMMSLKLAGLQEAREAADRLGVTLDLFGGKDKWSLSRIIVPKDARGEGAGSKVMAAVVAEADKDGATVTLSPDTAFGASSRARLVKFYKRFGFVENKGRNKDFRISDTMYRLPQGRLAGLPTRGRIALDTAKRALKKLPAKYQSCGITPALLREGMEVEREHRDVTGGRVGTTAKIASAHLCERRDYYRRLKRFVE